MAKDPSRGAASQALVALGRIGTAPAVEVLRSALDTGPADLRASAAEGCLLAAEQNLRQGKADVAAGLYDAVRALEVPKPLRLAAIRGGIIARKSGGPDLLVEHLRSADKAVREMAIHAAASVPDPSFTRALAGELSRAEPETQLLLISALVERGAAGDLGAVEGLAQSESPEVRVASLSALGKLGGDSSLPVLLGAVGRSEPEAEAAAASLVKLSAGNTDLALLQTLGSSPPATRVRLISVLGQRQARTALDALLKETGSADANVAKAAFDAIASVATPSELPGVVQALARNTDPAVRERAESALYAISLKRTDVARRSEGLAAAYADTREPRDKRSLLQVMGMLCDPVAFKTVSAAYRDPSAEVRETALGQLVHWPDATPVPMLLELLTAPNTSERDRVEALRGVVTLATLWANEPGRRPAAVVRPPEEAVKWLAAANQAVRDNVEEKRLIVSGLGDLNSMAGLRLLRPYLDDAKVQQEACVAALRAVKGLTAADEKAAARPILEKIVATTQNAEVRREAQELLSKGT